MQSAQILPSFTEVKTLDDNVNLDGLSINCAYLLNTENSLSDFIAKVGKQYESQNKPFNLYDFYTAYNLKFPTTPSTVSLIDETHIISVGIPDFFGLLTTLLANCKSDSQYAVFLSIVERTPEEMLRFKREIFQQFIYLRIYLPIIIAENFQDAKEIFTKVRNSSETEHTDITFVGTKKAGKSSLINAILGAEYSPSSSELPTPNKITYAWSDTQDKGLCIEYEGNAKKFNTVSELHDYLSTEFRKANKKESAALKSMQVYIPDFPVGLRNFSIVDTPGPNLAASKNKAHEKIAMDAMKEMNHAVFVMNYSAHLTDDEIKLFDKTYKVFNNKRHHQTIIVAVNRIDEMYASEEIKSYERFADYVRHRLNILGYDNIVVVGVSAITAVYTEKVRQIMPSEYADFGKCLKQLGREYKGTDSATPISFISKVLSNVEDFHELTIESLSGLKEISRIDYLQHIVAVTYNPAEHFEWVDETFADVFEEEFTDDIDFAARVRYFAEKGDADAMNMLGVLYSSGDGVAKDAKESFKWCHQAAEAGSPSGMVNVAFSYRYGAGVPKDTERAVQWYSKAIDAGNDDAMYELAMMYRYGDEIKKDERLAFQYCKQAADAGFVDGMVSLASMYFRGDCAEKDLKKSFEWNLKAAELENSTAMTNVAYCYRYGEGAHQNINRSLEWYNKAMDAGNTHAMCELARMYRDGENIEKDASKAFLLYKRAAEADDVDAMVALGSMYFSGEGTEENKKLSYKWSLLAAKKNDMTGMMNVAYLYRIGEGVAQDTNRALEWYNKAVDAGNTHAMCALAEMYRYGEHIEEDASKAFLLYQHAATAGEEEAFGNLAEMYDFGEGTREDHKKAFKWYQKAAEIGDADAMTRLGVMYDNGEGTSVDHQAATKLYQEAAKAGHVAAMCNLANNYRYGEGVTESSSDAVYWYEKAIENGSDDALYFLGDLYYDNGYYIKAFKYLKQSAEKGDSDAMNLVGNMYYAGKGTEQSYQQATDWYRKAADEGHVWGMRNLAHSLYVDKNFHEAFQWYERAAKKGNDDAMNELGDMYYNGYGTDQNYHMAVNWYRKAAEKGHGWAMWNLGHCFQNGYGVPYDFTDALFWYKRAAKAGVDDALKQIGRLCYKDERYSEAMEWYRESAQKGDADSMNYLGVMYHSGKGVHPNYNAALDWYRRAADAGSMWAVNNLGNAYYNGYGVSVNYDKAFECFRRAANEGNITSSMISLGNMYRYGKGRAIDYNTAMKWYKKARDAGDEDAQKCIESLVRERNEAQERKSSSSSSGGCFITTAVCNSFGKPDSCYELTAFRNFRDKWLANQPDGKSLISEYYEIAPKIVKEINILPDAGEIYLSIWNNFLKPCLAYIEQGKLPECKNTYIAMVRNLEKEYL